VNGGANTNTDFKKKEKLPLSILTNQMKVLSVFEYMNIKRSDPEANG